MPQATIDDVEARLGRPLDESETQIAESRLGDVELIILSRIPDLLARITSGAVSADVVAMVEADVVIRALRNPEGIIGETDGNYSYQLNYNKVSIRMELLPDEWRLLGLRRSVFVIAPRLDPA